MLFAFAAAVLLSVPAGGFDAVSPGDGLGLSPNPIANAVARPSPEPRSRQPTPVVFAGAATALVGGAVAYRRRRDDTPLLVVVHGNGGDTEDFDGLIDMMDVDGARVVAFDYSWVDGGSDSTSSSRTVSTEAAAEALDDFLRRLSLTNSNVYSLHHSKGGAVGVSVIASLDSGANAPIDGYRGAALLDPAIASGLLGSMQSAGTGHNWLPDDGGFDPIWCSDAGCTDVREHLGDASGVEVIAIRNRDALVTNFVDRPEGLRVFDLHDGLPSALLYGPFLLPRIFQAHNSVLTHQDVADCIGSEVTLAGSCDWGRGPSRVARTFGKLRSTAVFH